jgi:hypothetical protein
MQLPPTQRMELVAHMQSASETRADRMNHREKMILPKAAKLR